MAVVVYRSTDASAPVMDGQAGSLVNVLDGCLVNGYGVQPAAGWTKAFAATNKGSYRQGSSGFYLDVDDSAAQTAAGKEANVRGYETMSAIATGTNPFPTTAQVASPGPQVRKSAAATATARAWILAADDRTFHLFILTGDTGGVYYGMSFGDIYSLLAADAYKVMLQARNAANATTPDGMDSESATFSTGGNGYHSIARNSTGAAGARQLSQNAVGDANPGGPTGATTATLLDGNVYLAPYWLGGANEAAGFRGRRRGLWRIVTVTAADGDTFTGTGDLAGKSFQVISKGSNSGVLALETSDTWDTSA